MRPVCGCCRGGIVLMDVIWRQLCVRLKYYLKKGDLFVLMWARV